jgi:serine/threonine protein kinase
MISGAIYLDEFVVEPLTEYIWLGGAPHGHSRVPKAVRLFTALRDGISELKSYYESLEMTGPVTGFPFVTSFNEGGVNMEWKYHSQPYHRKLMYEAKLKDGRDVIIKFALTYNEEAHRLLAQEGYAPQLYHVSRKLYGGLRLIVMDRVRGRMLDDGGRLNASQYAGLKEALKVLHSGHMVHGDLRPPNIMILQKKGMDERTSGELKKSDEVMLIDFDNCGKAGVGKYPADLNVKLRWPPGVGPECIMEVKHDNAMLEKLKPFDSL